MPTSKERNRRRPIHERKDSSAPKILFGSYMPFAGVKYYTILDEHDIARHRHKIGPVGWSRGKQSLEEIPIGKAA